MNNQHLPMSPYAHLNNLLKQLDPSQLESSQKNTPQKDTPALMLHIGEPQRPVPKFVGDIIHQKQANFGFYPPAGATDEFREAVRKWVHQRYHLTPEQPLAVQPTCGGREALFQIALCLQSMQHLNKTDPVLLLPNPMYHVYQGAAKMAGFRAYPLNLTEENNYTPDFTTIPEDILQNTVLCYICNPNNPTGSVMDMARLNQIADDAEKYHFHIVADECYSEIYRQTPPVSFLQLLPTRPELLNRLWVVNSLSKRSGTPGLRIGMVITSDELSQYLQSLRSFSGAHVPPPLLSAAVALLQDEQHVVEGRAYYNQLFKIVKDVFAKKDCLDYIDIPEAGMFLWLKVGNKHDDGHNNGEDFAQKLWQTHHIKVIPGRYMCLAQENGSADSNTPGDKYVRIAIVHQETILRPALEKIAQFLLEYHKNK